MAEFEATGETTSGSKQPGSIADAAMSELGQDPTAPVGDFQFAQLADLQGDDLDALICHVQVLDLGRYVVALENNGWSGSHPEIARRCSADGGRFFSVYWNVNAYGMLTQAIDCKITANFEMLYPVAPDEQPHEVRPAWAIGRETAIEVVRQTCFALLEQQTGLAIDPSWLGEQRPTYRIPEPHRLFRDVDGADRIR